jgi:hypothetical protein
VENKIKLNMASTKRPNVAVSQAQLTNTIQIQQAQLQESLNKYNHKFGEYPLKLVNPVEEEKKKYDFINPQHYVQEDGRQTWEHMVDKWGLETTAMWCELTAYKYKDRIGRKPGEDVEREQNKIKWYEDKAAELRELAKKKKFW